MLCSYAPVSNKLVIALTDYPTLWHWRSFKKS